MTLRRAHRVPAASRRGMSLLEAVLASVLLALVASAVAAAVGFVRALDVTAERHLAAHEVANRLLLQYLHNPDSMPSQQAPVDHGQFRFRWSVGAGSVSMKRADPSARPGPNDDRFLLIAVEVFEAREVGSAVLAGDRLAIVTRLLDPAASAFRNPDATREQMADPRFIDRMMQVLDGGSGGRLGELPTGALDSGP